MWFITDREEEVKKEIWFYLNVFVCMIISHPDLFSPPLTLTTVVHSCPRAQ